MSKTSSVPQTPAGSTDAEVIRAALSGCARARRRLEARITPIIEVHVRRFFSRRGDATLGGRTAQDLVQHVWLRLLEHDARMLRGFDPARGGRLEGYIYMLCRRELWREHRKVTAPRRGGGQREMQLEGCVGQAGPPPEERLVRRDTLRRVVRHLEASLPERGRAVLRELYGRGVAPAEAAARLGVQRQVVYNWQHRIRGEARAALA